MKMDSADVGLLGRNVMWTYRTKPVYNRTAQQYLTHGGGGQC